MTVLLIFVVLNCSMARYNGRLHCIVGVLPTCYKRKAATYFYPRVARGQNYNDLLEIATSELSVNDKIENFSKFLSENSKHVFGKL